MGNLFNRWYDYFFSYPQCKILFGGLDAAGKTTMLYRLFRGETIPVTPTIGFNVETIQINEMNMVLWDIGGRSKIFALYKYYFDELDAFVIVVDSNDPERFKDVQENVLH